MSERNEMGNLIKGWDAKNNTYNQVYAKKYGNKIFANTGIIAVSDADKKKYEQKHKIPFDKDQMHQGFITLAELNNQFSKISKVKEAKIITEKSESGVIHRIMIRVK